MARWIYFRVKIAKQLIADQRIAIIGDGSVLGDWANFKRPGSYKTTWDR